MAVHVSHIQKLLLSHCYLDTIPISAAQANGNNNNINNNNIISLLDLREMHDLKVVELITQEIGIKLDRKDGSSYRFVLFIQFEFPAPPTTTTEKKQ